MNHPAKKSISGLYLSACSGILIGCAYPPFHYGYIATFALVPWMFATEDEGVDFGRWLKLTMIMLVVSSFIELYWAGGLFGSPLRFRRDFYFLGLGILAILINPVSLLVFLSIWKLVRRFSDRWTGFSLLPVFWIAGERLQTTFEIFMPWTPIGGSFTDHLLPAQLASIGGVSILSFWALVLNMIVFGIVRMFAGLHGANSGTRRMILFFTWMIVFVVPLWFGWNELRRPENGGEYRGSEFRISLVQPNVNAYEKWRGNGAQEVANLTAMTKDVVHRENSDCVIWPESAIPLFIFDAENDSIRKSVLSMVDELGCTVITGYDDKYYFKSGEPLTVNRKESKDGRSYEIHNGSMVLAPYSEDIQKYWKIHLVPFTESVPFARLLPFLNIDFLRLHLGFDDCAPGTDTSVFTVVSRRGDTVRITALICYESAFPEYTSQFVRKGAGIIGIVTNDSWWGNTSGPYQHERFAVIRAIENRRWVVQCANGGISAIIDPYGRTIDESGMFTKETITRSIPCRSDAEMTFFTIHGDWLGRGCISASIILGALAGITRIYRRYSVKG